MKPTCFDSKITFTQIADCRFAFGMSDRETGLSPRQWAELERILEKRKEKIERNLRTLASVSVETERTRRTGGQVRQRYFVTKVGRRTTWNEVYQAVNAVRPVPYDKVG